MAEKNNEIWVAGFPSFHGGADTELAHQIILLRSKGVRVTLVPMFGADIAMRVVMERLGCRIRDYKPDVFKGKIVVAFCNGEFLKRLPEIYAAGKPRAVAWANCMTWTFPDEVAAHGRGWITHHIFQTDYQRDWILHKLEAARPVHEMPYLPYYDINLNPQGLRFSPNPPGQYFGVGRISRDDGAKYSHDMWRIMERILTPGPKKVFVLGFGPEARKKCGGPPDSLDWWLAGAGGAPVAEVYGRIHALVHRTGGSRENLPRVMMEAWHAGVALICEDDYGFREHISNGVNGWRCGSSEEMSYRASQLAFDEPLRQKIIAAGYEYLVSQFGDREQCWKGWETLFAEAGRRALPV